MNKIKLLLFVILSTMLTASFAFAAGNNFKADLEGLNEVPSVDTKAKGEAKFELSTSGKSMKYTLVVRDIENVLSAHIHLGAPGKNGTVLVNIYNDKKKEGKFRGSLSQSTITDKDLIGELKGKSISDLVALIKSGDAYVNVHTDAYPDGEIRGQIK